MVTEVEFEEIPGVLALHLANKTVLKVTGDSNLSLAIDSNIHRHIVIITDSS